MKLIKLVFVVGGLAAVAYGGAKFYLNHKVSTELDKGISMARPFVDVSYKSLGSDLLNGALIIEDIKLTPTEFPEGIGIGKVILRGDGPGFLLDLVAGNLGPEPPQQMHLIFSRMSIPLELAVLNQQPSGISLDQAYVAQSCTLGGIIQHVGLDELGYQQLMADGSMRYRLGPGGDGLKAEMEYSLTGVESSSFDIDVSGPISPAAAALGTMPTINSITMHYQMDPVYSQGMLKHCAKKSGQDPKQYLRSLISMDDAEYAKQLGFVPGPGLRKALFQMIGDSAEVRVTSQPSPDFDLASVGFYKPEQLVELFGIELSVNEQIITDMSYTLAPKSRALLSKLNAGDEGSTGVADKKQKVKRPKFVKRYLPIKTAELSKAIGRDVKLYTAQAEKPREGNLRGIKEKIANLEQRMHGGKVELHVPLSRVIKAEVLTSVKVE